MTIKDSKKFCPLDVAAWFINRVDRDSGDAITHLKLQKLLYYAQAWWLANENVSVFDEDIQAWAHGPVVPSVYQEYKDSNWQSLSPIEDFQFPDESFESYLDAIYKKYGKHSAKQLEKLTHQEDPWKQTRGSISPEAKCNKSIDKILIRDYYAGRIDEKWP